jgi:radical SAM superfamily enzyme YgiQ (UPF0313 family)
MPASEAICTAIKRRTPEQRVLLVGGHVAALPERTLREGDADFAAGGEGPVTLFELIEALREPSPRLPAVRGLYYREEGRVVANPPAPLVSDVDHEMPEVAWDLLPMALYRAHNWHCFGHLERQPYAALYTTLGCPYHCSFCCIQAPFKSGERLAGRSAKANSYRFWSPQRVVSQIETLVDKYGVRNLKLADEMFVLHPKHVSGICEAITERGYDLNTWAYARVDTVRDAMLPRLERAGFRWLAFGIESANERVRDAVDKGFDHDDMLRTLARVRDTGINIGANYIFGLPEDDLETMQQTLDLAREINAEWANFYCTMAYPGSPLYAMAVEQEWPLPKTWAGYSQHAVDTTPLPTRHVSGAEVVRFRDRAFDDYFGSPRYLDMIRRKFGDETVAHIRRMTSVRLDRQPDLSACGADNSVP